MRSDLCLALFVALTACGGSEPAPSGLTLPAGTPVAVVEAPRVPKAEKDRTVLDVALDSPDHTTLVAAVKAAGKEDALDSPGGIYTVFAPTNDAFAALPAGTVEGLLAPEKQADLRAIVQHHAAVPIIEQKDMTDGQVIMMADGTAVTLRVDGDRVTVDGSNIVGSVRAMNGIVYVVDKVLLPPTL